MAHIVVALSGGVDSAVAAALLKEEGHFVEAGHMMTGFHSGDRTPNALKNAERIAEHLSITFHVWDLSADFKNEIVDYFIRSYLNGLTPNPCVVCNPEIKFGSFLQKARELGAGFVATGHYACKVWDITTGRWLLKRGVDQQKDQSYFLHRMSQAQLSPALFPLGGMHKKQVKEIADDLGLGRLTTPESQEFCFLGRRNYTDFINETFDCSQRAGELVDTCGNFLGRHKGVHCFTVGQRRGLNLPSTEPYYVLEIIPSLNRVVIGRKGELLSSEAIVDQVNWIAKSPLQSFRTSTRIRFRHREVLSTIHPVDDAAVRVVFDHDVQAVTPGQAAVFYDGEVVLGGGWIKKAIKK
jgi:tRNA-uridine 2-sulfurtransferase